MGVFDDVHFSCPNCDGPVYVQSKAGPCALRTYSQSEVPTNIAEDIEGDLVWCEKCSRTFSVRTVTEIKGVSMELASDYHTCRCGDKTEDACPHNKWCR